MKKKAKMSKKQKKTVKNNEKMAKLSKNREKTFKNIIKA